MPRKIHVKYETDNEVISLIHNEILQINKKVMNKGHGQIETMASTMWKELIINY